ncbi:hypothetical protein [Streptomyces sp. AP-93]|uniref:hypothetical protein n=1 Tax=Streptomyces sp. AP-93 TaxID=2929048 RepID=UPI001FAF1ED5|nr:hypothetical protein [Streptomyces sp. AP-93]MCJ0873150.1 hypothetical protein [Streptomyces sp. AP-93]
MRRISSLLMVVGTTVVLTVSGAVGAVAAPAPSDAPAAAVAPAPAPAPAGKKPTVRTTGETVGVPLPFVEVLGFDRYQATLDDTNMDPVRLDVRRAGTTEVVQSITTFKKFTEHDDYSYWDSDPIVLDAVGFYEVDLHAKDPATGQEGSRSGSGKFFYGPDAVIDIASSKQEFTLDSRGAVATGRVTAKDPKTGARVPVAGTQVKVSTYSTNSFSGKTDADGRYSIPFSATGTEGILKLTAEFGDDLSHREGHAALKIKPQKAFVTMTGPTKDLTLDYGYNWFPGKMTRLADDGTVKPVGAGHDTHGKCVAPASCTNYLSGRATRADGSFRVLARVEQPGTWNVWTYGPWLETSTRGSLSIAKVNNTTRMTEEKLTTTSDGKLRFTGKALLIDSTIKTDATIAVQALQPDGTWWTVRTASRAFGTAFSVTADVPRFAANAYRLSVVGSKTRAPSAGTKLLKPSKLHTWFAPSKLPRTLPKGSPLTMKGTLYTLTPEGTAKPLTGQKVHYFFKPTGSTTWKEVSSSTTSSTGYYRRSVIPTGSGDWQVRFTDGGTTRFNNTTDSVNVTVR